MSQLPPSPDHRVTPPTPRWVKAFGIIALILVVLFIILQLTGVAGEHGPGRHSALGVQLLTVSAAALVPRIS